jgi:predicted transcriptional regulator
VVCRRLARKGLAERRDDGRYVLSPDLRKKQLRKARA